MQQALDLAWAPELPINPGRDARHCAGHAAENVVQPFNIEDDGRDEINSRASISAKDYDFTSKYRGPQLPAASMRQRTFGDWAIQLQ